jgi:hypothetical protein
MDWRDVKRAYRSFRPQGKQMAAEQAFHRLVRWIYELEGEEDGREFMMGVVDPDPMIDRNTGHELGEDCPRHPGNRLIAAGWGPLPGFYMSCDKCPEHREGWGDSPAMKLSKTTGRKPA